METSSQHIDPVLHYQQFEDIFVEGIINSVLHYKKDRKTGKEFTFGSIYTVHTTKEEALTILSSHRVNKEDQREQSLLFALDANQEVVGAYDIEYYDSGTVVGVVASAESGRQIGLSLGIVLLHTIQEYVNQIQIPLTYKVTNSVKAHLVSHQEKHNLSDEGVNYLQAITKPWDQLFKPGGALGFISEEERSVRHFYPSMQPAYAGSVRDIIINDNGGITWVIQEGNETLYDTLQEQGILDRKFILHEMERSRKKLRRLVQESTSAI